MSYLAVFRQPKHFYFIFNIEVWERFGFCGLEAILAIFFVNSLNLSEKTSFDLFAAFEALVYGTIALGGYFGDKIGALRMILVGTFILFFGYSILAVFSKNESMIYYAISCIAVGVGLFKANPSRLLAMCYKKNDPRLHGAFTMYYMAINIGAFLSIIIIPYISKIYGWSASFYSCACALLILLFLVFFNQKKLRNIGHRADNTPINKTFFCFVLCITMLLILLGQWLLHHLELTKFAIIATIALVIVIYLKLAFLEEKPARQQMFVAFFLMMQSIIFYVVYTQQPTSFNFFAIHNVTAKVFGFNFNPASFQAMNPLWIMLLSPLLSLLHGHLGHQNRDFSLAAKFTLGMFFVSFSFLILTLGARFATHAMVSPIWLIVSYGLGAIGELLIAALGLAMVAQLVPKRVQGFIMGVWFLSSASASLIGGGVASLTTSPAHSNHYQTLLIYNHFFYEMGVILFIVALFMLLLVPKISKYC